MAGEGLSQIKNINQKICSKLNGGGGNKWES